MTYNQNDFENNWALSRRETEDEVTWAFESLTDEQNTERYHDLSGHFARLAVRSSIKNLYAPDPKFSNLNGHRTPK